MAGIEVKRSVRKKQSPRRRGRLNPATRKSKIQARRGPRGLRSKNKKAYRRLFHFPQTRGKLVEDVEFSTCSNYHNISINFKDKTCLNFSIETGFFLETDYSDWKTGNQRVIRAWPPLHSKT
jgi:hypothetical protein